MAFSSTITVCSLPKLFRTKNRGYRSPFARVIGRDPGTDRWTRLGKVRSYSVVAGLPSKSAGAAPGTTLRRRRRNGSRFGLHRDDGPPHAPSLWRCERRFSETLSGSDTSLRGARPRRLWARRVESSVRRRSAIPLFLESHALLRIRHREAALHALGRRTAGGQRSAHRGRVHALGRGEYKGENRHARYQISVRRLRAVRGI